MNIAEDKVDWTLTTWKGAQREQLRLWLRLSVRERLEAVEQMGHMAEALRSSRQASTRKAIVAEPPVQKPFY